MSSNISSKHYFICPLTTILSSDNLSNKSNLVDLHVNYENYILENKTFYLNETYLSLLLTSFELNKSIKN